MSGVHTGLIRFRDNGSPDVTLETSLNYESLIQYEIILRACDPYAMCTSTLLRLAVVDCNEPPSFFPNTNMNFELAVASHATSGTAMGVLQAGDPDLGDVLTFSLVSSASMPSTNTKDGTSVFAVNPQSGELTVASSQSIQQLQTGYSFMLTAKVTDSKGLAATTPIIVNVVANNAPPVCQAGISVYMSENAPVGTQLGSPLSSYVTDADIGTTFTFSLQHPYLSVNPSSGQLFVTSGSNLDFESSTQNSTTASVVVTDDGAYHNGLNTLATSCIVFVTALDVNEAPTTTDLSLSITEGTNSNPSRALPTETFTFPILSPQDDYIIAKKSTGGYATNSTRKTLPMGYDFFSRTSVGVVLRFTGVRLPDVIDRLSMAQLRFAVPSGKIGPFSIQIRVINESAVSWSSNQPLESFGMPAFVTWTVEKELSATTIWSPSITSLLVGLLPNILSTNNVAILITGGGIGEVSAFDRGAATAAVLEMTVAQVSRVSIMGGMVSYADPDALDSVRFAIVKGNPPSPVFFVDKKNGEITANIDLLNFEVQNTYELQISATDTSGLAALSTIRIAIADANEPPVVSEMVCYVAENTPVGSSICAIPASDPDNSDLATGKLVYYLAQSSNSEDTTFQIDPLSGMLLVANSTLLNFEVRQKFVVTVCAKDDGNPSLSGCGFTTVYLTDSNDAPTTITPQICTMDEYMYDYTDEQVGRLVGTVVCNLTVLDEDNGGSANISWKNHVWQVVEADRGCPFNLTSQGQVVVNNPRSVNYEHQKVWSLLVQATDLGGLSSTPQRIEIIIQDVNEKPQISASTFYIDENSVAGTLATGYFTIFDPDTRSDGQPDTVIIRLVTELDTFNVVSNNIRLESGTLDFESKSSYLISVVATDQSGASSSVQTINIVVNNVNEVPTIASMQVSIPENQPAMTKILPAVKANDPDGDSVSFSLVSETPKGAATRAPTAFGIDAITGLLFQQVGQLDYEDATEYALVVKARDTAGLFSTAIVTVTITDVNEAPSIRHQIVSIREDASVGTSVGQAFAALSSDPDLKNGVEVLTFTMANASQSPFSIDSKSGQVVASAHLDFEAVSGYNLRVRVVDLNGLSGEADFVVTIIDVNEPPVIGSFSISVPENLVPGSTLGDPVIAIDLDTGSNLYYDLIGTSDIVTACIRVNSFTGQLALKVDCSLDYEASTGNTLSVIVRASDGEFTVSTKGTIYIIDVNEAPVLVASESTLLKENSIDETVVTLIMAQDPDVNEYHQFWICEQSHSNAFRIQTTGVNTAEIVVKDAAVLNYEKNPSLWIDACVKDRGNLTARARYTVNLVNVFEPPYFVQETIQFTVDESILVDSTIGSPLSRLVVDEENLNTVIGCSVEMSIVNTTCGRRASFSLDSCGQMTLSSGELDYETMSTCVVYVQLPVTNLYNANTSSLSLVDTIAVVLTISDVNEPPTFAQKVYQFGLAESSTEGTLAGVLSATDVDAGDIVLFQILNAETGYEGVFKVSISGEITLAGLLDYEKKQSYHLSVRVLDRLGAYADASVIISVTDSDEPPVFQASRYSFTMVENAPVQTVLGDVTAIDSDTYQNKTMVYSIISGNDLGAFAMLSVAGDGRIVVSSQQALDYERQGSFTLLVEATDSIQGGLRSFATAYVDIKDVNEPPQVSPVTVYIPEDAVIATGHLAATAVLEIVVLDRNDAPIITSTAFSFAENQPRDSVVGVIQVTDEDFDQQHFFTVVGTTLVLRNNSTEVRANNDVVSVGPSSGSIQVLNDTVFDYEAVRQVVVVVTVSDDGNPIKQTTGSLTIELTNENERCAFPEAVLTLSISENVVERLVKSKLLIRTQTRRRPGAQSVDGNLDWVRSDDGSHARLLVWDPENDTVTLSQNSSDYFSISDDGFIYMEKPVNYEVKSSYDLLVTATDSYGLQTSAIVRIDIADLNEPPVFTSQPTLSVSEGASRGTVLGVVGAAYDPDEYDVVSYQLVSATDHNGLSVDMFMLHSCDGELRMSKSDALDYESHDRYGMFEIRQTNDDYWMALQKSVDVNEPPIVASVIKREVEENAPLYANVGLPIETNDPDAQDVVRFSIVTDKSGPVPFTIDYNTGQLRVSGDVDYETQDLYSLHVTVEDSALNVVATLVEISIVDVNERPQLPRNCYVREDGNAEDRYEYNKDVCIEASEDIEVGALLHQFTALDPDSSQRLFYSVSESSNPFVRVTQNDDRSCELIYSRAIFDYESSKLHRVQLTVTDTGKGFLSDTVMVFISIVDVNEPPSLLQASTLNLVVAENSVSGQVLGQLQGVDPEGDAFKFSFKDSSPVPNAVEIRQDGQILTTGASIDYEALANMNSVWMEPVLTIRGAITSLNAVSTTFAFVITVADVPEPPSFMNDNEPPLCSLLQCWVLENSAGLFKGLPGTQGLCQVEVQDLDIGQKHTFQLLSSPDSTFFSIDFATGVVRFTSGQQIYANFEVQSVYRLRYQANDIPDTGLSLSCSNEIAISVVDVNDAPVIPGRQSLVVAEMSAEGTIVGTISAVDEDKGDGLQAVAILTVTVININDPPVLQSSNFTANEYALSKTSDSSGARNLELLGSIHCFDEDVGDELSFTLLNDTPAFVIEAKSGMLYAETRFLDFETTRAFDLAIQCSDGQAAAVSTSWVFVTNLNEAPTVAGEVYRVQENTPLGSSIGFIRVSDVEHDDESFLTIASHATGSTNVVARLQDQAPVFSDSLDVEWTNIPKILLDAFFVTTSMSAPLSNVKLNLASSGDIFVLVEDDSDVLPAWMSQNAFVKVEGQTITAQSSTSATSYEIYIRETSGGDFEIPDTAAFNMLCVFGAYPSPLEYFIHGPRSDWFDVSTSGELLLATATLDFESIAASAQPLQISVNVVDSGGLMGEATLPIYVDDVNEAPVITSCCFEIAENPAIGTMIGELTATDPDLSDQITFELAFPSTDISLTSSGNLSVRDSSLFDYERNSLVTIRVRASDRAGLFHEREIQIKVLDVNEPPAFQQTSYSFGVPETLHPD
ncbi:hypothetical protein PInf_015340 [Phytophthora infestans]|nr:hypothetical protein PInf_015340 [Phytophthora infestans]